MFVFVRFYRALARAWALPDFRTLTMLALGTLASGTMFYHWWEGWNWLDSFYFSFITLTTVGYGDFSPQTAAGKLFTVVYLTVGLGIIAGFVTTLAGHVTEISHERQQARTGDDDTA